MERSKSMLTGFYGTYASPESRGIYRFTFDTQSGAFTDKGLYFEAPDCKYLSLWNGILAAPVRRQDGSGLCLLKPKAEDAVLLGMDFEEEVPAAYVTQDQWGVYTANYHQGSILIYQRTPGGPRLLNRLETGEHSGCHQIILWGPYLLAPCLLQDRIVIYDRRDGYSQVGQIDLPRGSGPRHGVFGADQKTLYLVTELSNELYVFRAECGVDFQLQSRIPLLDQNALVGEAAPASAAIRLGPEGRTLTISIRFADCITVCALEEDGRHPRVIQQASSGGQHPRDFIITRDGRFILAANREAGGIVSIRRDPQSGRLQDIAGRLPAIQAVSLVLEEC
jgi:6-phosphogluconolactonase